MSNHLEESNDVFDIRLQFFWLPVAIAFEECIDVPLELKPHRKRLKQE